MKRIVTGLVCVFSAAASFAACTSTIPSPGEERLAGGDCRYRVSSHLVPQSWDSLDGTEYVVHIDQKVKGKQTGEITIFSEHTENGFRLQVRQTVPALSHQQLPPLDDQHVWQLRPVDEGSSVIRQLVHGNGND